MTPRVCFVIETMEVIDGQKLKSAHPDKHGYYTVPLAVVGRVTQNRTFYIPQPFIEAMVGQNSPFALQVRAGNMFGEYGHPFTQDLSRIGIVMESMQAMHIRKVFTRDLPDGTVLIMGEIKPFGPYGKYLEESLASPFINTAFSLRSLCTEVPNRKENRIDRTIKYFVTFDHVGSSGYKESTKRYVDYGTNGGTESASFTSNYVFDVTPEDFFSKEGSLLPAFESSNLITDDWLCDLFGAKEIRLTSKSIPVKYFNGRYSVIDENGNRAGLVNTMWNK